MSYTPAFETVEVGMQTVWGTAVTPTAKLSLIEECEIEPIQESEVIPELRGTLAGNYTASLNKGRISAYRSGHPYNVMKIFTVGIEFTFGRINHFQTFQ